MKAKQQTFGARLRAARKAAGVTQVELAKRLGLQQNRISDYERGTVPSVEIAARLARAIGVPLDSLVD
jgi:putative transcriptional regulator